MEKQTYQFHIIDLQSDDIPLNDGEYGKDFVITIYGKTSEGKNVVCNVVGFKPYFYMKIPDNWGIPTIRSFLKTISYFSKNGKSKNTWNSWNGNYEQDLLSKSRNYQFYGYNYDNETDKIKKYNFAKISFQNYGDMKKCISAIQDFYKTNLTLIEKNTFISSYNGKKEPQFRNLDGKVKKWFTQEHNCDCIANLYESKLHPMLRFLHEKNINSCGWVEINVNPTMISTTETKKFNVEVEVENITLKSIQPIDVDEIAPFIICSFDIECDSSHGDFPNPKKDFKKLAIDIHESYFRNGYNFNTHTYDFKIKTIKKMIQDAFKDGSNDVQNIFTENGTYSESSFSSITNVFTKEFIELLDNSKENTKARDKMITDMGIIFDKFKNDNGENIVIKGDPIIQIGSVFHRYGDQKAYNRSIIVIGNEDKPDEEICDDIEGVTIYRCQTEKDLLLKWKDLMLYHNPDIVTGYNIFGFDFDYINKRVEYLFPHNSGCKKGYGGRYRCCAKCPQNDFYRIGRLMRNRNSDIIEEMNDDVNTVKTTAGYYNNYWEKKCQFTKKELSSSGLGDNILSYISMDGRVVFDIQKEIQKGHALDSYTLDNVSAHFMKGKLSIKFRTSEYTVIETDNIGNLKKGDYISINLNTKFGLMKHQSGKKYKILAANVKTKYIRVEGCIKFKEYKKDTISREWCLSKDDVSPQELFQLHKNGGATGRAKIAKYCIMDCELCIHLLLLQDLIPNNIGMANVSCVPLSYIFLRGQGIKIFSLMTKRCDLEKTRIPTLKGFSDSDGMNDGFEGAIVLEPDPGIYLDDPVSVLDYASLYPNSIIEKNLSHETYICSKDDIDKNPEKYKFLEKLPHYIISYDDYIYEKKGKTVHKIKANTQTTCYFAKPKDGKIGIVPTVLKSLLDERKQTRALAKKTPDENKKKVLDGLQLAYKVTANSVYGQMGARTSSMFFKKIAACTTSIGRERIYDAASGVKEWALENDYKPPEVVYGDTDSVFVKFSREKKNENGEWEKLVGKEALQYCIDCGIKAGEWITERKFRANGPQDLEYEKTFYPFILISKKRYTGDKYEYSADKLKERTSMGIVMKRRDNAPIVKYVFGNVIEIIMNQKSVDLAIEWLKNTLKKISKGELDTSMFIITKSLSGYYKNPEGIAHKALADRMAERNPGNKPKPNDRIPYMYRVLPDDMLYDFNNCYKSGARKGQPREKKILQGDRVEHPDYIKEKNLKIDYSFYISNQIMNPVKQVLDLDKDEEDTKTIFTSYM